MEGEKKWRNKEDKGAGEERKTGDSSREKEEIRPAEAQQGGEQEDWGKNKRENRDSERQSKLLEITQRRK